MRSYRQFCAVARALDVVGERWTLLLVRELLPGPRRFADLLDGLPGIGPNLLAARLRRLEDEGLVRRASLPPPAASRVYELTERGRGLEEVVLALARWGMSPIAPPSPDDRLSPAWYAVALRAAFRPEQAAGLHEEYELRVDGAVFHLAVADGAARAAHGPARDPACVVTAPLPDLLAIVTRARAARPDEVAGDAAALERFVRAFALPRPLDAPDQARTKWRQTAGSPDS